MLDVWQQLLVQPTTTLPAASCLRGQLLSMLGLLVEAVLTDTAAKHNLMSPVAVMTAMMRLLEFNHSIGRYVVAASPQRVEQSGSRTADPNAVGV
jgi:hypothetical protein